MPLSEYTRDQIETLLMIRRGLGGMSPRETADIRRRIGPYLRFREEVARFQRQVFSEICTRKCFTDRASACCGREGIAVFFGDVVVNLILTPSDEIERLLDTLYRDSGGFKCVYLTDEGCLWRLKPIVCEMFHCEEAKEAAFGNDPALRARWEGLRRREKRYTWPDRPVLFDELEDLFIRTGCRSPLMYFHQSPGLLRVKTRAQKLRSSKRS